MKQHSGHRTDAEHMLPVRHGKVVHDWKCGNPELVRSLKKFYDAGWQIVIGKDASRGGTHMLAFELVDRREGRICHSLPMRKGYVMVLDIDEKHLPEGDYVYVCSYGDAEKKEFGVLSWALHGGELKEWAHERR